MSDSHTAHEPCPTAAMERQHRKCEDEYAKLWQMYGDLEDDRVRLRGALRGLVETTTPGEHLKRLAAAERLLQQDANVAPARQEAGE